MEEEGNRYTSRNHGIALHRDGLELYDDGKHLGRIVPGKRLVGLYKERKSYMSTTYRRKIVEFVNKEFDWNNAEIVWF